MAEFNLSKQQILMIKRSFRTIARNHDRIAQLFYEKMFELDPELRPLFKVSLLDQRMKLMQMLAILVSGLDDVSFLTTASIDLGKRHISYGVKPSHYATVGKALLWAMRESTPDVMTDSVTEAWTALYVFISETAVSASYEPSDSPQEESST